jgi:aryl-alcohol dehydrogenase-like predicted oxidoreductase
MKLKTLGTSDLKASVIGIGTWAIAGDYWGESDDAESVKAIQAGIDFGINLIDTAPAYGDGYSEELVGKAIKGRRDGLIIATKVGILRDGQEFINCLKPESIYKEIDNSLRRLGVDCIDLYQIHWPDPATPFEDTMPALIKLYEQGKFRCLGVSNFSEEQIEQVSKYLKIVSQQLSYSILERETEKSMLPYCIKKGMGIITYGSLGAGVLSGKYKKDHQFKAGDRRKEFYPYFENDRFDCIQELLKTLRMIAEKYGKPVSHVAINWVWKHEGVTSALVGVRNRQQAEENAKAGYWELSMEEMDLIDNAYQKYILKGE